MKWGLALRRVLDMQGLRVHMEAAVWTELSIHTAARADAPYILANLHPYVILTNDQTSSMLFFCWRIQCRQNCGQIWKQFARYRGQAEL